MSKRTNLDIKDAACIHIVHILQHPTSRPTTKSMQTTIVNTPKKNLLQLPAGKYRTSTKRSTQWRHQANEGKSGLEAERVGALRVLRRLEFIKKLGAEKQRETHFSSNEEIEETIEKYVQRETAGARNRVEDPEAAVQHEQDKSKKAKNAGWTNREPDKTCPEMMVCIGDRQSYLASSDHGGDGEDEDDEETKLGQLSEDDEPCWVMGTISKMVEQRMERLRWKQKKLEELTEPGWEDATDYFCEIDTMYGTFELRVRPVIEQETNDDPSACAPRTFWELMESLDPVPGISQKRRGTSRAGSSPVRVDSGKPQSNMTIPGLAPAGVPHSSIIQSAKPVELVRCYSSI